MNDAAAPRSSGGDIASYDQGRQIASVLSAGYVAAAPVYAGWRTYASQQPVLFVATLRGGQKYWLAGRWGVTQISLSQGLAATRYHSEHGLPGNAVAGLCVDKDGVAWAAAAEGAVIAGDGVTGGDGALAWQDGDMWRVYPFPLPAPPGRFASPVRCLTPDDVGGIWAATGSAIYRIPGRATAPDVIAQWPEAAAIDVVALLADEGGVLAATPGGLFRVGTAGAVTPVAADVLGECSALCRDQRGTVWAAGSGALVQVGGAAEPVKIPGGRRVRALTSYSRRVWALTSGGLGYWQEGFGWRDFPMSAVGGPIHAIAAYERDDILLMGTEDGFSFLMLSLDAHDLPPRRMRPPLPPHGDNHPALGCCNALAGPDALGRVWVGGSGGLAVIPATPTPGPNATDGKPVFALADDVVSVFGPTLGGQMLLRLMTEGLLGADAAAEAESVADGSAFGRIEDRRQALPLQVSFDGDGLPCCATGRGLWRFDDAAWERFAPALPGGRYPTVLAPSPAGAWWAGADDDLFALDDGEWRSATEGGPPVKGVRCLLWLGQTAWIGATTGLWAWESGGVRRQTVDPARPDAPVQALAVGNGGLWVALDTGIVRLDPATGQSGPLMTPTNSGLASAAVNALLETDGVLWIATAAGLSRWTIS